MPDAPPPDGAVTRAVEFLFVLARWLIVPSLAALLVPPVAIAAHLWLEMGALASHWASVSRTELLLLSLHSVDLVLVAALVLMVTLSAYDETVSRLDGRDGPAWLGKIDTGGLKLKIVLSILAIATIELLGDTLGIDGLSDRYLGWSVGIYAMFLLGAGAMVLAGRGGAARH